jgi:hypothetical protein
MFARLTPVLIALFAMVGAVAAQANDGCTNVCCDNVVVVSGRIVSPLLCLLTGGNDQNPPMGYGGTGCSVLYDDEPCLDKKVCCNVVVNRSLPTDFPALERETI